MSKHQKLRLRLAGQGRRDPIVRAIVSPYDPNHVQLVVDTERGVCPLAVLDSLDEAEMLAEGIMQAVDKIRSTSPTEHLKARAT